MTAEECKLNTIMHIENVRKYIKILTDKLTMRGINHDKSKLEEPELDHRIRKYYVINLGGISNEIKHYTRKTQYVPAFNLLTSLAISTPIS